MEKISNSLETYQLDLEELNKLISQSTRPNVKRHLEEVKKNLTFLCEEEKKKLNTEKKEESTSTKNESTSSTTKQLDLQVAPITKYAFENGDKFVKIYLTEGFNNLKEHPKENILAKFYKKSFDLCILNWNKKNFRFGCNDLNKEIDPEGSYTKQTSSGLIVYLKKAKSSEFWDSLEKKKSPLGTEDEKPNKSKDPNESLMDMMREMYQNGDPEMKRIIAESWTKSRSGETPKGFDL